MSEETKAETIILRIAAAKEADIDKAEHIPELEQYRKTTRWVIRELRRAAHWAAFGHDPGDGATMHECGEGENQ